MRGAQVELLAPAGDWESARAAVANGADAVYFGTDRFNARMRADNFALEEVTALMLYLHREGKRGYAALNVLIFPGEEEAAEAYLGELDAAGVDGVIVQDMGLAAVVAEKKREGVWRMELHISTQMSVTGPEAVKLVDELYSPEQIVLARELSLREIAACAAATGARIEVFCHGALCVAYSGQCLTSESLGCRSANRGECAQACRLPYRLELDGKLVDLEKRPYLFSPQDLCSIELVPQMLRAGVRSFKIEGRLKKPEYVAAVTGAYRRALDAALVGESLDERTRLQDLYAMSMTFSRGFSTGWLEGTDHPKLTHGRFGRKRGIWVGLVRAVEEGKIILDREPQIPLAAGDGFVLDTGENDEKETGGCISYARGDTLFFHPRACNIRWTEVRPGQSVLKSSDPTLEKKLRASWMSQREPERRVCVLPVMYVRGRVGEPLEIECGGVVVHSETALSPARQRPLTAEVVKEKLSRTGGTGYVAGRIECEFEEGMILPVSELNRMRRELLKQLSENHPKKYPIEFHQERQIHAAAPTQVYELRVLCRSLEQALSAAESGVTNLYLDAPKPGDLSRWGQSLRDRFPSVKLMPATLRIMKPHEAGYFKFIREMNPDGVLVRNLGAAMWWLRNETRVPLFGDFSLNTSNAKSLQLWKSLGLASCTVSYDLNADQINALLDSGCGPDLELTLHQHMPLFHCEHCVFCTFLSHGHSFKDCGRPCENHHVKIIDRKGSAHELRSDEGCRNTLFNARAQTAARCVFPAMRAGLSRFRIELLEEDADRTRRLISLYRNFMNRQLSIDQLLANLEAIDRPGVTEIESTR